MSSKRGALFQLSALEARAKIEQGLLSSVDLVSDCLDRIAATDDQIKAWAFVDWEGALKRAKMLDDMRKAGKAFGRLHGIPVGLKDIIDTKTMKTERGTGIFAGRKPEKDARIVELLLGEGAIVLGKTKTTELAFMHASDTRNPHNPDYSPGGSSSGSAAAVAALHIPLAIGTQTNGSVIRPASFCGTFGIKPSRGMVSRNGLLETSRSLDQVGGFARTLEDAALLMDVIGGYDEEDALSFPHPRPDLFAGCSQELPINPDLAVFNLPFSDRMSSDVKDGLDELISEFRRIGIRVEPIEAPGAFSSLLETHRLIHEYEICEHLKETFDQHWAKVSDTLKPVIERGRKITKAQYEDALGLKRNAEQFFDVFFHDYDAVVCPSAPGEAPLFGGGTGDPVFSTIWTLCGLPCVSLPLLEGSNGLPIGVQLISAGERDDRLMRLANWVLRKLKDNQIQ